jgi:type I restriction enzyme R subunit
LGPQPEQEARRGIDAALAKAGWSVCDADKANIHGARGRSGLAEGPVNLRPAERVAMDRQPWAFSRSRDSAAKKAIREFPLKSGHGFADGSEVRAAGQGRPVRGFADYLLCIDGKAAGVIEAKREGSTLTGVEIQSAKYSTGLPENLPAWARPLPFSYQSTGTETRFTNGLDPAPRSRPVFAFHKPETLADFLEVGRVKERSDEPASAAAEAAATYDASRGTFLARLQHMPALKEAGLWPAQIKAIQNLEHSLKENRPRALIQMGERRVKEP